MTIDMALSGDAEYHYVGTGYCQYGYIGGNEDKLPLPMNATQPPQACRAKCNANRLCHFVSSATTGACEESYAC